MSSLLEKLKSGIANKRSIKFPGTDIDVNIRVLSEQDYHEAGLAADAVYKLAGIKIAMENVSDYEAEKNLQLLYRALSDPETNGPICKDMVNFRRLLSRDSRNLLIQELDALEEECSPNPYKISDDEFSALLLQVKKNAETTVTSVSSLLLAKKLVVTLAAELHHLQPGNGSLSSQ